MYPFSSLAACKSGSEDRLEASTRSSVKRTLATFKRCYANKVQRTGFEKISRPTA